MKISLLHPSRNRGLKARSAAREWLAKSTGDYEIEYILSLDNDDSQIFMYKESLWDIASDFPHVSVKLSIGESNFVVAATNRAAKKATGDVLIFMADDFGCPDKWDVKILKEIAAKYYENNKLVALLIEDCCNKNYNVLTLPIITKAVYNTYGYFFHPCFKSIFCDNFMFHQADIRGYLVKALHLEFPHYHYSNINETLKGKEDETYMRSNGLYDEGRRTFNKLSAELGWNIHYD